MEHDDHEIYYYSEDRDTKINMPRTMTMNGISGFSINGPQGSTTMNGSINTNTIATGSLSYASAEDQLKAAKDRIKAEKARKKLQKAREDEARRLEAMKLSLSIAAPGEPGTDVVDRAKKIARYVEGK